MYSRGDDDLLNVRASPILKNAQEIVMAMSAGTIRAEYQEFGINLSELGDFHLPQENDLITRANGDEFLVITPIGVQEKCYRFTTSARERVIVCCIRHKDGTDE